VRAAQSSETGDDDAPTGVFVRPSSNLWDAQDVARYLKVSRSWVYQRAEAGLLPCVRVGGLLRFRPDSVRAIGNEGVARQKKRQARPLLQRTVDGKDGRTMLKPMRVAVGEGRDADREGR
jgi:excisionase family DNA binding protein